MRIGEVARQAGLRVSHIRYYEDVGLLPPPERVSGQRHYDETVLRRLTVIDIAQRAGLSLGEIRVLLEHGNEPAAEPLRALAQRRLPEVDALIARAQRIRQWLVEASECRCQTIDACALFDDLALPPTTRDPRVQGSMSSVAPGRLHHDEHQLPKGPPLT